MEKHVKLIHKKYKCNECNAAFDLNYLLVSHVKKIHPKKKEVLEKIPHSQKTFPYKCDSCEKSFSKKFHLHVHTKNAHDRKR